MSFVVPKEVAHKGAPIPSNPDVTLREIPAARYVAYRFSGSSKPEPSEKAAARLLAWTESEHLHTAGSTIFAYYTPPGPLGSCAATRC